MTFKQKTKMIKRAVLFVFACCAVQSHAQSTFNIGPVYSAGASDMLSASMGGMKMGVGMNNSMGMIFSAAAGIKAEYFFEDQWGLFLQTGLQRRGAMFNEYLDEYKPRYHLDYWDAILGVAFRTQGLVKSPQLAINLGVSQSTLLDANRVNDTGSDYVIHEFKKVDIGLFLGIGGNIPMAGKDIFQIQLFANAGFLQVFSGNLAMNGMNGTNFVTGVQIAYLIGVVDP